MNIAKCELSSIAKCDVSTTAKFELSRQPSLSSLGAPSLIRVVSPSLDSLAYPKWSSVVSTSFIRLVARGLNRLVPPSLTGLGSPSLTGLVPPRSDNLKFSRKFKFTSSSRSTQTHLTIQTVDTTQFKPGVPNPPSNKLNTYLQRRRRYIEPRHGSSSGTTWTMESAVATFPPPAVEETLTPHHTRFQCISKSAQSPLEARAAQKSPHICNVETVLNPDRIFHWHNSERYPMPHFPCVCVCVK